MRMRGIGLLALTACVAVAIVGCGSHSGPSESPALNVVIRFYWPSADGPSRIIPAETQTIHVVVTADGMTTVTGSVDKSQVQDNQAEMALFVPSGAARRFTARAKDASAAVIAEGTTTVDVAEGAVTDASINMDAPQFTVSPDRLDFGLMETEKTFTASNPGTVLINWACTIPGTAGWISNVSPSSGELHPGTSQNVTVNVSRAGRTWGPYSADLLLTYNGGDATVAVSMQVPAPLADGPWPMFRHDLLHTARSSHVGSNTSALDWTFGIGYLHYSSPIIGPDGTVYAGGARLYAINPNGSEKWNFFTTSDYRGSPALAADGTVYAGCYDHRLYAISSDGTEKWHFGIDDDVRSSPAIGPDGTIYVAGANKLFAVNPDGTQKWAFGIGSMRHSSPAIGSDGTIYIGGSKLYAVNPNGTQKWAFAAGNWIESSPAIGADGTVYVGSWDGKVYAVNPDGTQKWAFTAGGPVYSSAAIGPAGTVYIGSEDDKLHALDPDDGTEDWAFPTGGDVNSSPAVGADGTIFVGSCDYKVYAINPNGSQQWAYTTGAEVESSPAIGADGTVYVGSRNGNIYAFAQ